MESVRKGQKKRTSASEELKIRKSNQRGSESEKRKIIRSGSEKIKIGRSGSEDQDQRRSRLEDQVQSDQD